MNTASLVWGLLFGSIGLGYFLYGKRRDNVVARLSGLALMVYPYFFDNTAALLAVGIVLMSLPKFVEL